MSGRVSLGVFPRRRGVGRRIGGVTIGPARPPGSRITQARRAATRLGATAMRYRRRPAAPPTNRRRAVVRPQRILPTPGTTSQSVLRLSRRATPQVKAMKRVGAPNYYVTNMAAQTQCLQGYQEQSNFTWQGQVDIQNIIKKVPNNTALSPWARTNRFVLESMMGELLISNSTLASAYVEIYDIARRRDANVTEFPFTAQPGAAWQQGVYNAAGSPNPDQYRVKNSSPFDSQIFRDFFKVVKRTRVELSQGATHRHSVLLKSNRLIDASIPNFVDGDAVGIAMYTMVVFYGQPASVPTEAGAVVTTAAVALDYVQSVRYKYTFVQDTTEAMYITDNLSTLIGEQVVSLGAGQIVPNAKV